MVNQFEVYRHPQFSKRAAFPFIIILQHDSIAPQAGEVLAAPLAQRNRSAPDRFQPLLIIEGSTFQLLTAMLGRVPVREFKMPVARLEDHNRRILAAIDLLFAGS